MNEILQSENVKRLELENPVSKESSEKEIIDIKISNNPLEYSIANLENLSLESLKFNNEISFEIKETKLEQFERNRENGKNREDFAFKELSNEYPENDGFKIEREQYLRNHEGKIVKDPLTEGARRVDFVVIKNDKVVNSIEVTSRNAPKEAQIEKENRIRSEGGNFIKDRDSGNLVIFAEGVLTQIRRY